MLIAISPEPIGKGIRKGDNAKSKKGILVCDTSPCPVLPNTIKIFPRVFELQSCHEINIKNITKGDSAKSKKPELSFLYASCHLILF